MGKLSLLSKIKRPFSDSSAKSSTFTPSQPSYHMVSAEDVRDLNALIRLRYRLDHEIWEQRRCTRAARLGVFAKIERSDAVLARLRRKVEDWDHRECWETDEEWSKLQNIRRRLDCDGKRDRAPWEEVKIETQVRVVDRLIELA